MRDISDWYDTWEGLFEAAWEINRLKDPFYPFEEPNARMPAIFFSSLNLTAKQL